MSWNSIHNGNRVEGSDTESHYLYKNANGSKIDGSIEDAIDATAQVNGLGALAKQSNTNSMFASSKIIKDMLKNRGVQPSASADFDLYPTGIITVGFVEDGWGDGFTDLSQNTIWTQKIRFIINLVNFKLPYDLIYKISLGANNGRIKLNDDIDNFGNNAEGSIVIPEGVSGVFEISFILEINSATALDAGLGKYSMSTTQYAGEGMLVYLREPALEGGGYTYTLITLIPYLANKAYNVQDGFSGINWIDLPPKIFIFSENNPGSTIRQTTIDPLDGMYYLETEEGLIAIGTQIKGGSKNGNYYGVDLDGDVNMQLDKDYAISGGVTIDNFNTTNNVGTISARW